MRRGSFALRAQDWGVSLLLLRLVPAAVVELLRSLDLRVGDDEVAAQAAEVGQRLPAALGGALEERGHAGGQRLDHVRAYGVIEHGGGAHLHGSASEEEIVEGVIERGDAADAGERAVGERIG